jgi:hypothetical protein
MAETSRDFESHIESKPYLFAILVVLLGVLSIWALRSYTEVVRADFFTR